MQHPHFKLLLRSAVIAALPLTSQVGCATTEAKVEKEADPCRSGNVTSKSAEETFSSQMAQLTEAPTAEQCLSLCKKEFERRRIGGFNDLVKLEKINASDCKTENRPYSLAIPGGRYPTPSTLISCQVDYTALHDPYTCPKPVPGRMPDGVRIDASTAKTHNRLGQYLADMATMETAAITAFQHLALELEAYGAPTALIARAQKAVLEETRHAEMAGLLSSAYDATVAEIHVDDFQLRSLYEIALENAVEGCVNETFAAACGLWQSQQAQLPVFRDVIAHITEEELGHAALSWDIHEWIMPQLSTAEQEQIRLAQAKAVDKLIEDFKQEGDPIIQQAFGLPTKDDAVRLFSQLQDSVWGMVRTSTFGYV